MSPTMHTTCTPAVQVQARDAGRRNKKLCVEEEWRQGGGAHTVQQGSTAHRFPPHQGATHAWGGGAEYGAAGVEGLLAEW